MHERALGATTVDRVRIAASAWGHGPPLLLIPGLGASRRVFAPIVAPLARRHEVISFDPRGVGESRHGASPITMAALAADAVAVLDAAGAGAADVLGASMGGVVAQHLVVEHRSRVRRLVLAATGPGGDLLVPARSGVRAALLGKGSRTPEDAYRLACTVLYSAQFQRTHQEFIEEQIRMRGEHPVRPGVFSEQLKALRAPDDSFARLATVTAPTLVLHGTEDAVTPWENARILAAQMPHATARWFEGCGHLFFHERPDESARVVDEFLRGAVGYEADQAGTAPSSSRGFVPPSTAPPSPSPPASDAAPVEL